MKAKTVYVVGAGASAPFGMPTGARLKKLIIGSFEKKGKSFDSVVHPCINNSDQDFHRSTVFNFYSDFKQSPVVSIDAFLAARPEFRPIGKFMIAWCLLKEQRSAKICEDDTEGHWLRYLFNELELHRFPERLSEIVFLTFNYDLLIEHFFTNSFIRTFGQSSEEQKNKVQEALEHLKVIHVHGQLAQYSFEGFKELQNYDEEDLRHSYQAIETLRVIGESSSQGNEFSTLLEQAGKIVFMGFGFSAENLQSICPPRGFEDSFVPTFATMMGLEKREREMAKERAGLLADDESYVGDKHTDCLGLLRQMDALPEMKKQLIL